MPTHTVDPFGAYGLTKIQTEPLAPNGSATTVAGTFAQWINDNLAAIDAALDNLTNEIGGLDNQFEMRVDNRVNQGVGVGDGKIALNADGTVSSDTTATISGPADVQNLQAAFDYNGSDDYYPNDGYEFVARVWAYKTVGGTQIFSSDYAEVIFTDSGTSDATYSFTLSWDSVAMADGYAITLTDSYNGMTVGDSFTSTTATTFPFGSDFWNNVGMGEFYDTSVVETSLGDVLAWTQNGRLGIGTLDPSYPLDVTGDIHTGGYFRGNGSQLTNLPGATQWTTSGANIIYTAAGTGSVGIGGTPSLNGAKGLHIISNSQTVPPCLSITNNNTTGTLTGTQSQFLVGQDVASGKYFILNYYNQNFTTAIAYAKPSSALILSAFGATGGMFMGTGANAPFTFVSSAVPRGTLDGAGNFCFGVAALATNATNGFTYIPSCAGTPTGTPATKTGCVPMVYDSTNHKFYIYDGGWKTTTVFA